MEGRLGEAQVEEDEEGGQGLHVRLQAAHLDRKAEGSRLAESSPPGLGFPLLAQLQGLASVSAKLPDTSCYFI